MSTMVRAVSVAVRIQKIFVSAVGFSADRVGFAQLRIKEIINR
jgi:hypothetical protein